MCARSLLKEWGRLLFEARWATAIRVAVSLGEASREEKFLARQAELSGRQMFQAEEFQSLLRRKESADTLFVMGSGASIRKLTLQNFTQIRAQRSVGVNNWGLHPFVPDFYALESVPGVGDGKDFARAVGLLSRDDVVAARPPLLVLRPRAGLNLPELDRLPSLLGDRVFYYGRVSPSTRRLENLESDIGRILRLLSRRHSGVFFDSGASVVRMLGVALSLGLTRVVLTGVDLDNTKYFWEDNPDYDLSALENGPVNNQESSWGGKLSSGLHETMNPATRPFSVFDFLKSYAPILLNDFGLNVLVASPESRLAEILPTFDWAPDES